MKVLTIISLLPLAAMPAAAAAPKPVDGDNCLLSADTQSSNHLADIPAAILKRIPRLGESIPPVPDDAVVETKDPPGVHLIRAFWRVDRWVVVYSTGGSAGARRAAVLDLSDGKATPVNNNELWRYPGGACQAVDVGFDAKPAQQR